MGATDISKTFANKEITWGNEKKEGPKAGLWAILLSIERTGPSQGDQAAKSAENPEGKSTLMGRGAQSIGSSGQLWQPFLGLFAANMYMCKKLAL